MKFILLQSTGKLKKGHNLAELSKQMFTQCEITESYLDWVNEFCEQYSKYIEYGNVEYFRYPDYRDKNFFAGYSLDIKWLSYNFAIILLKLIHFAKLDDEFQVKMP